LSDFIDSCRGGPLTLLLDYDGTLVPIAPTPDQAQPDAELFTLLSALARRPDRHIHIVSGRPQHTIDAWFGKLAISLWAEHGFWWRAATGHEWCAAAAPPTEALARTLPIFDRFTRLTPGSFIERKTASLAWHYRGAAPREGDDQAHALRALLEESLADSPLEVLPGKKVVEVRPRGISKGEVARHVLSMRRDPAPVVAIGDDETDEDLFAALPGSALTIAVGTGPTRARFVVADHHAARDLLAALVD
jgi:trehalose 6-phosphate synthase/phosphatase